MRIQLGCKGAYTIVQRQYLTAYEYDSVVGYAQRDSDYFSGTQQALKHIKQNK